MKTRAERLNELADNYLRPLGLTQTVIPDDERKLIKGIYIAGYEAASEQVEALVVALDTLNEGILQKNISLFERGQQLALDALATFKQKGE